MNCTCAVDFDADGEVTAEIECVLRKARKVHKCSECGRAILRHEQYEIYKGVCGGNFFTNKTCTDCMSIRDVFFPGGYWFRQIKWDFFDLIIQKDGEVPEKCLAALTPRAREMAFAQMEEIWLNELLDNPTTPAHRLEILFGKPIGSLTKAQGWILERKSDLELMDEAVWDAAISESNRQEDRLK